MNGTRDVGRRSDRFVARSGNRRSGEYEKERKKTKIFILLSARTSWTNRPGLLSAEGKRRRRRGAKREIVSPSESFCFCAWTSYVYTNVTSFSFPIFFPCAGNKVRASPGEEKKNERERKKKTPKRGIIFYNDVLMAEGRLSSATYPRTPECVNTRRMSAGLSRTQRVVP